MNNTLFTEYCEDIKYNEMLEAIELLDRFVAITNDPETSQDEKENIETVTKELESYLDKLSNTDMENLLLTKLLAKGYTEQQIAIFVNINADVFDILDELVKTSLDEHYAELEIVPATSTVH